MKRAFSLIEMMIVLAVVGLLLAFAAPNLFSLISSNTLTSEGSVLRNQLTLAQQLAISKSADVEVRFFKLADFAAAETTEQVRAFQLFQYNLEGELVPVSSFFRIRPPVAINQRLSTIVPQSAPEMSRTDEKFGFVSPRFGTYDAPVGDNGALETTEYISFRFRPDGSTDLPYRAEGSDTWYITLVQGEGAADDTDPANFLCLQVNPYNGQISEFRP